MSIPVANAALEKFTAVLHGAADAADRLREKPKVDIEIAVASGVAGDRGRAEEIARGQWNETVKKLTEAVERKLNKR